MTGKITQLKTQRAAIDRRAELPFSLLHADDNVTLILYEPPAEDRQTPHDQDEYYFVASGSAEIRIEDTVTVVAVGDAIFVPALAEHRFERASDDFTCWALFYGPRKSNPPTSESPES